MEIGPNLRARRHFTLKEITQILREIEEGSTVIEVCARYNVCENTIFRWRRDTGRSGTAGARRLASLEEENASLRRQLAELARPTQKAIYQA